MGTVLTITEEELDGVEAKIVSEFTKFEELKYAMPSLFMAAVSKAFKSLRDKEAEPACVNCVSWQPYMSEGMCRVKIKCTDTGKMATQTTFEDFWCKHHAKTYEIGKK